MVVTWFGVRPVRAAIRTAGRTTQWITVLWLIWSPIANYGTAGVHFAIFAVGMQGQGVLPQRSS